MKPNEILMISLSVLELDNSLDSGVEHKEMEPPPYNAKDSTRYNQGPTRVCGVGG